jgi:hypothetical protein
VGRGRFNEAIAQQAHGALADGEQQFFLIAKIYLHQGARQARAARHLIYRQRIPPPLGIQLFRGIQNLGAPSLLLLSPAFSDI